MPKLSALLTLAAACAIFSLSCDSPPGRAGLNDLDRRDDGCTAKFVSLGHVQAPDLSDPHVYEFIAVAGCRKSRSKPRRLLALATSVSISVPRIHSAGEVQVASEAL